MFKFWPFPIVRNYPTSRELTKLFLAFAESKELKVEQRDEHYIKLRCEYGELRFWNANQFYAWAQDGEFTPCFGQPEGWKDEMPSRYAVRKLVRATQAKRFVFPVPSREEVSA